MADRSVPSAAPETTITQNPDIRYLGRLLGDVIRAYGGDKLYRQTEYIRSASVDRARGVEGAHLADTGLEVTGASAVEWMGFAQAFAGEPGTGRSPGQFAR